MPSTIPVIDIAGIGIQKSDDELSPKELNQVANEFLSAFTQSGFLYLKNHGISNIKLELASKVTGDFFALPPEVKANYAFKKLNEANHGYVGPNEEFQDRKNVQEIRESYTIRHLDGTFPDPEVPVMRYCVKDLCNDFEQLSKRLFQVLSVALGLDDINYFVKCHHGMISGCGESAMRFLNYPRVEEAGNGVVKLGEHADWGTFTLLYQDGTGGLELKSVDNSWVQATPISDTLLFNVAEMLEIWSGGKFPATKHRVHIAGRNKDDNPRRSMAFFVGPSKDTVVQPLDGSTKLKPVTYGDHLLKRLEEVYAKNKNY